jgi:F0F1-type ATP synthase assembly protein I
MLTGVGLLFATGASVDTTMDSVRANGREKLMAASIPSATITQVLASEALTESSREALTPAQQRAVDEVKVELSAGTVGAGLGATMAGGASLFVLVSSLIGGLLGWLLVMKKRVLQCTECAATTAAS